MVPCLLFIVSRLFLVVCRQSDLAIVALHSNPTAACVDLRVGKATTCSIGDLGCCMTTFSALQGTFLLTDGGGMVKKDQITTA